jgi:hypothetical protein
MELWNHLQGKAYLLSIELAGKDKYPQTFSGRMDKPLPLTKGPD